MACSIVSLLKIRRGKNCFWAVNLGKLSITYLLKCADTSCKVLNPWGACLVCISPDYIDSLFLLAASKYASVIEMH